MDFLELGKDIEFIRFNRKTSEYHFQIQNQEAVNKFLGQAELIKFLTDPVTPGEPTTSGCRIAFDMTSKHGELIISRQVNPQTMMFAAFRDLLMTLNTYVIPTAKENCEPEWLDMVSDFFLAEDSRVPLKQLPRGDQFLTATSTPTPTI